MVRLAVVFYALVGVGIVSTWSAGQTASTQPPGTQPAGTQAPDTQPPIDDSSPGRRGSGREASGRDAGARESRGLNLPQNPLERRAANTPAAESNRPGIRARAGAQPRSSGRSVALDVTIAEFADSAKTAASLPLESGQKTLERIRELESQGKVALVTRVRLATVDGQPAMLQIGEQASLATSRRVGGRPLREGGGFEPAAASYVRQNVGLLIGATPRVQSDGSLSVDLDLEKSQIAPRPPRDGAGDGAPRVSRT